MTLYSQDSFLDTCINTFFHFSSRLPLLLTWLLLLLLAKLHTLPLHPWLVFLKIHKVFVSLTRIIITPPSLFFRFPGDPVSWIHRHLRYRENEIDTSISFASSSRFESRCFFVDLEILFSRQFSLSESEEDEKKEVTPVHDWISPRD